MQFKQSWPLILKLVLFVTWFALFAAGFEHYSGSRFLYIIFSFIFLVMLVSGIKRHFSYGYFFLVWMLWLGFWVKMTVHLLVSYPFQEPVGFFVGNPKSWDDVLLISTIGGISVVGAKYVYDLAGKFLILPPPPEPYSQPLWYMSIRKYLWGGLILTNVILALINSILGIQQSGLVPHTILLWPFNALIYWLLGNGIALMIATLLWWDISIKQNISWTVYSIPVMGFFSTVSLLSRSVYVFQTIPLYFALFKNRKKFIGFSKQNFIGIVTTSLLLFLFSIPLVNGLRNHFYSNVPLENILTGPSGSYGGLVKFSVNLARFSVDRWIGLDGVMAVSAYPKKSNELFIQGLTEHAEIGKPTLYQEICQSNYRFMDMNKYQFASLPGAVAFLYITGHWWAIFLGMFILIFLLLASERLVLKFTSNPLLGALWGISTANAIAQMGIAPRGLLVYFFEMICGIVTISFLQTKWFSNIIMNIDFLKMKNEHER
jgi:hypothetical protein